MHAWQCTFPMLGRCIGVACALVKRACCSGTDTHECSNVHGMRPLLPGAPCSWPLGNAGLSVVSPSLIYLAASGQAPAYLAINAIIAIPALSFKSQASLRIAGATKLNFVVRLPVAAAYASDCAGLAFVCV